MKKYIKVVILSLVSVLVLNIILFSVLTVVQAPYYEAAPSKVNSIYELYASEEYNEVVYRTALDYISEEEETKNFSDVFQSLSAVKLSKIESYFKMLSLGKKDFVLMTFKVIDDTKVAIGNLAVSNIIVYLKNNEVYVGCIEFVKNTPANSRIAIYEVEHENEELIKLLTEYKTDKKEGFYMLKPNWRYDISMLSESLNGKLYVLSFFVEFVVAVFVINKFLISKQKANQ